MLALILTLFCAFLPYAISAAEQEDAKVLSIVRVSDNAVYECRDCSGKGKIKKMYPEGRRKGRISDYSSYMKCPRCKGTGKVVTGSIRHIYKVSANWSTDISFSFDDRISIRYDDIEDRYDILYSDFLHVSDVAISIRKNASTGVCRFRYYVWLTTDKPARVIEDTRVKLSGGNGVCDGTAYLNPANSELSEKFKWVSIVQVSLPADKACIPVDKIRVYDRLSGSFTFDLSKFNVEQYKNVLMLYNMLLDEDVQLQYEEK